MFVENLRSPVKSATRKYTLERDESKSAAFFAMQEQLKEWLQVSIIPTTKKVNSIIWEIEWQWNEIQIDFQQINISIFVAIHKNSIFLQSLLKIEFETNESPSRCMLASCVYDLMFSLVRQLRPNGLLCQLLSAALPSSYTYTPVLVKLVIIIAWFLKLTKVIVS